MGMTWGLPGREHHADRVFEVVRGGARDRAHDTVARSWRRCLHTHRLHPDHPPNPVPLVTPTDLQRRQALLADVLDCARYEMSALYQQLGDEETVVLLTDTDGVILHTVATAAFLAQMADHGLRVGAIWSEAAAGTNGMGTCLAEVAPVAVRREEHFYTRFTELTCSAVPVCDPLGRLTAVLDVSSRSTQSQQHLLVLLGMTARMIENLLIDQRHRDAHVVHVHSRPEFIHTLHEGRLAVSAAGEVLAANRSALEQLGLAQVADIRGQRVEALFRLPLPELLARSRAAAYHPVVAWRAHGAQCCHVVARPPVGQGNRDAVPAPPPRRGAPVPVMATFADARMAHALRVAQRVTARATPVLLSGETGSGKEVFARAVHASSPLAAGPFVTLNCASLPEPLIESELFGHRSGRRGKIAQADGGTLFLDEIGDMPLALQARLLRVLEDQQVTPLGAEAAQRVEFQLISASHRDLLARIEQGLFREDLYYRVAGVALTLPPLRERSDRRELILGLLAEEAGVCARLSQAAEDLLMAHRWPGNVRQLRHALRAAAALAEGPMLEPGDFPVLQAHSEAGLAQPLAAEADAGLPPLAPSQAQERQQVLQQLAQHRWNVTQVAKVLGVSRNTLYRKLHKLRIPVSHPSP